MLERQSASQGAMRGDAAQVQRRLTTSERVQVLLVPWGFVAIYAAIYVGLVLPRAASGHVLAVIVAAIIACVWLVFAVAAVTFSRDVLAGRWPA